MKIYTKTGDMGETSLFGGARLSKADIRVETYGTLDELTSIIGLLISRIRNRKTKIYLVQIQKDLHKIMGVLAGRELDITYLNQSIQSFEQEIDKMTSRLPKLTRFILPGGTENSAFAHLARTTTRKAERNVVSLYSNKKAAKNIGKYRLIVIQYLNRLSDYLFTLARHLGKRQEIVT